MMFSGKCTVEKDQSPVVWTVPINSVQSGRRIPGDWRIRFMQITFRLQFMDTSFFEVLYC